MLDSFEEEKGRGKGKEKGGGVVMIEDGGGSRNLAWKS